jgi:hypothetical protein
MLGHSPADRLGDKPLTCHNPNMSTEQEAIGCPECLLFVFLFLDKGVAT